MTFKEWICEIENFSARYERLCEDFPEITNLNKLRMWLMAAYDVGYDAGRRSINKQVDTK